MSFRIYISGLLLLLASCGGGNHKVHEKEMAPIVSKGGASIMFRDTQSVAFFKTETVKKGIAMTDLTAPAKIAATVLPSGEGGSQNVVLFGNPELASNYTQLIQHQVNVTQIRNVLIRQKEIELHRTKDLLQHGAATGKDLLDAQTALAMEHTQLANEKAALIEHEAKLKSGGFNPEALRKAPAGTAYLICDIPENQVSEIKEGSTCVIRFSAFPGEQFTGKVEDVADVVDNVTRMVKLRITVDNSSSKLKAGMFALVSFGLIEGGFISVSSNSMVTVQGKNYVLVKKGAMEFERREVQTGRQIGDKIVITNGLIDGEAVVVQGVMQMKGLSFGY